jgi:hypothetical protein
MDISPAALPPRAPVYTEADKAHPLFPTYRQHMTFCAHKMIQASDFRDWLYQYNQENAYFTARKHPDYPTFLSWITAERGGARPCPAGQFPHNFAFWREGGRW